MKQSLLATALMAASMAASATAAPLQRATTSAPTADARFERAAATVNNGWVNTQGPERRRDERRGRGIGAVLYSDPDFRGGRFAVQGDYMRNLADTGFNDRAQSLQVERGYWMFCSDADFQGTCRTFGPGDYRRLPRGLDNRISSGRRISENYPYQGRPNWDRR
jgi:hypothetical protein